MSSEEMRNTYKISIKISERKRPLGRRGRRFEGNITMEQGMRTGI
jgi:hypothetical protein